ncbi:hypothetical protein GB937_006535, partial [Aspergillus fischeri]
MQSQKKVRLFPNLWLPDPEQALSSQELIYVQKLIPLIQCLEMQWDKELKEADARQICSLGWNLDEAYERLQENEAAWWKARGVTRPREFLVRPSGKLNAPFVFTLRVAMKAKVEICWGANVRERMLKKLDLQPLRLWGDFAGLVLHLELTPDKASLTRFIIFVAHPQRFMRKISSRTDLEVAFYLLQKCKGSPETLDILTLAISVLAAYGWMIARPRKPCVDDMLILRKYPTDIVPRKCSECGKEQLDDPFAYWSKFDPSRYVLWYHFRSGCGRPDCKTQNASLLPLNPLT